MDFITDLFCCESKTCVDTPPVSPQLNSRRIIMNTPYNQRCASLIRRARNEGIPQTTMKPMSAQVGDAITFHSSFDVSNINRYNIVWFIGQHMITKSNSRFTVTNDGYVQTLYIPNVAFTMFGNVVCELREYNAMNKECVTAMAISHLIVVGREYVPVPRNIVQNETSTPN